MKFVLFLMLMAIPWLGSAQRLGCPSCTLGEDRYMKVQQKEYKLLYSVKNVCPSNIKNVVDLHEYIVVDTLVNWSPPAVQSCQREPEAQASRCLSALTSKENKALLRSLIKTRLFDSYLINKLNVKPEDIEQIKNDLKKLSKK